ncbi:MULTISPECIES: hypothetical protein [Streptomyces]|uniref:Uncharacterized protein n=1 Tax=Streptomyces dengpaensis TaxID=2049881 RepID=A0ABM6SVX4_9ACTN|nr:MULTISPECIES: hypothetical protein [Streptomyces]AVH58726.1 hypothetical protein C4B68_26510 [Streptomyces dengpaensis]PIB11212.1 hypothetical protein B1C81_05130 [Streptomyces sp. HG99]
MAEYEGVDALLAAITDEPLPEEVQDDAAFMAEHGSALADVALLKEQLTLIGDALADSTETGEPVARTARKPRRPRGARKPRNRRPSAGPRKRFRRPDALAVALGTFAVAVVASMVVGMSWLIAHSGVGGGDDTASSARADSDNKDAGSADRTGGAESSLSAPGYIACSRLIAEGTVAEVEPVPGVAQDRITLDVARYYKPDKGKDQVTFVMNEDVDPRLRKGDHVLVGIPRNAASPDIWSTREKDIARERAWILKALPQSRGLACE